ncbi:hypothetical protein NHX12_016750 [Muraenolepis orangiensis]|uniref:G-protein coupled receptors family 1 profile domain-containing protein n=1 Tax=Muraenolepis orangiensis TaxID=630683 RepID=A0A9Q0D3Z6_9TELE|nr:hypothetical protein NHX12_016750 [Muraenolepis orangiensis]
MGSGNTTLDPVSDSPGAKQNSCDVLAHQGTATVLFPVYYSLLFLISAGGNGLVLYVLCCSKQKCNSTSIYLMNLALCDSLFTLVLPLRITYLVRHSDWPFGDAMCTLTAVIFFGNTYAGMGFMTCISVDRYLAVVHPHRLRGLRSVRAVRLVCCLVWAAVFLEVFALLYKLKLVEHGHRLTCMEHFNFADSRGKRYVVLLLACAVSFCVPLALILGFYAGINRKLRAAASFGPYHVNIMQFMARALLRQPSCQEEVDFKVSLQVTVSLMNMNCILDPILYFFAVKTYKRRVMSVYGRMTKVLQPSSDSQGEEQQLYLKEINTANEHKQ